MLSDLEASLRRILREEFRELFAEVLPSAVREAADGDAGSEGELRAIARYVTVNQAAQLAGVSPGTIRNWLRAGKLRRCGPGRTLRIQLAELVAFLDGSDDEARDDANEARIRELERR